MSSFTVDSFVYMRPSAATGSVGGLTNSDIDFDGDFRIKRRAYDQDMRRRRTIRRDVKVDDRGDYHCVDGPAFIDDSALHSWQGNVLTVTDQRSHEHFYWHGHRVGRDLVMRPELITVAAIEEQENAEVRRVMIERYVGSDPKDGLDGYGRYIRDCKAKRRDRSKWGILWEKRLPGDETLVMVEVVNSTPEPDGTFRKYFLRVDPACRSARDAIAWTFGMLAKEYQPLMET